MLSTLFSLLSDLFYPHNCPGCGKRFPALWLCATGAGRECTIPGPFTRTAWGCPHLDGLFFLFDYAGAIQEALHKAKFEKRRRTCCLGWPGSGRRAWPGRDALPGSCRKKWTFV